MRFLVFAGKFFYPHGGWDDLKLITGNYDSAIDFAKTAANTASDFDWSQVVDTETMRAIFEVNPMNPMESE